MRLGELIKIRKGKKPALITSTPTGGFQRLIQIDDLRPGASPKYCPPSTDGVFVLETDVVIAWDGANAGTSSFGISGVLGSTLAALRPTNPEIFTPYLGHYIRAREGYIRSRCKGATVPHVDGASLEGLEVPVPPLPEQRRIAEILDKADALRTKRHTTLAQIGALTQSIFLDMFGDMRKERTRWPTVAFEEIVKETKLGLVRNSQEFGPDFPIPYVRMNAITRDGELELGGVQCTHATDAEVEAYRLEPGDFLFNTRNSEELVGKTALYRGEGLHLFNNNVMRIRFTTEADPEFVAAAFKTAFVQHELNLRKSGTTNVFAIYYKDLRSLLLPLPPIKLQRDFACRVAAIEKWKAAHSASLEEFDALFAALQHRAFRGEL